MTQMYAITATVNGRQVPTFYLHPDVQGLMSEAAAIRIAADIINPMDNHELVLSICAELVIIIIGPNHDVNSDPGHPTILS